ncbi:MAG: serine--tRNA ligase [candidate division Zixibacteria bacterium]|nr:serine--tRNA ligase [candidate division Zixibacteria bacterium]
MLDIKIIRDNPDLVKAGAVNKNDKCDIDLILDLDTQRREIIREVESLKAERNQASAQIAKKKKAGEDAEEAILATRQLGEQIAAKDQALRDIETRLSEQTARVPNLPHESVPIGRDELANQVIREWGTKSEYNFKVLPHWEIGEKLGLLDLSAATAMSGSGFWTLRGMGARLQRALIQYMLDLHIADGFVEVAVPFLVTGDSMFGTGQLPKLADDMYHVESDDLWLIPTAEVSVTNLYRQQIIAEEQLPIKLVAHSPCFRREAGAAGKDTRGLLRVHQFDKVEMVKIVKPDDSYNELETLTAQAEKVLQGLNLHYRVATLATGDLSFASAKTYDLELWSAGVGRYLEISSISNFESFQARRMNLRYRDANKKPVFPHTLNGSGLALPRLMAAIMENWQNEDGTITIPKVLQSYMGGAEQIR